MTDSRFQEWMHPNEIVGSTILDLGCGEGELSAYCVEHNTKEYTGIDIDQQLITNAKIIYPSVNFIKQDLEEYVNNCVEQHKTFDIIILSKVLQGIHNQTNLLQQLSKITNRIIIEAGVPANVSSYKLLELLKSINLPNDYNAQIDNIMQYIEYEQPFIEYLVDDRFINVIPSIGFFKEIFNKLGFQLDLGTHEKVKNMYPNKYGYAYRPLEDNKIKKCILKFKKINHPTPVTWQEWHTKKHI